MCTKNTLSMHNSKSFILKLLSQLRIPSEREIRDLQLTQIRRELRQTNFSEKFTTSAKCSCYNRSEETDRVRCDARRAHQQS